MVSKILEERNLAPLKSRDEMLSKLLEEQYGYIPKPDSVTFERDPEYGKTCFPFWNEAWPLDLINVKKINVSCIFGGKEFSFPIYMNTPRSGEKHRLLVNLSYRGHVSSYLYPGELIASNGFVTMAICYSDIATDDNDFTNGLAGVLFENGKRDDIDAGKLSMWAWAMSIALDYADEYEDFDNSCYVATGHGRLGKAALLATAMDERFTHVFANGTGHGGAALSAGKKGETVKDVIKLSPWLFCKNYYKYQSFKPEFDQHYIMASIAPRYAYISGASDDSWNDPESEFLSCIAANEAYEKLGEKGLVSNGKMPNPGDIFHDGKIGYHLRKGDYGLSRFDWERFVDFVNKHRGVYKEKQRNDIKQLLKERNLPPLKSKEEMLDILQREEYGYLPPKPDSIKFKETLDFPVSTLCSGKAVCKKIDVTVSIYGEEFTFPIYMLTPNKSGRFPFFVCINFKRDGEFYDRFIATEEIIENGFALLTFGYQDVTKDNEDFTDGLAGVIYKNKERGGSDPSKIAMWAWAAQRVLDYAETQPVLDMDCAVVCGHSRLGKTALLAGATDERFKYIHSNNSGACGAALSRGKIGETLTVMSRVMWWYCNNLAKYEYNEDVAEFDQHYLLASIAPRYVYVASAYEDTWADPDSEFLSCVAASKEFEKYGKKGIICDDRLPEIGDEYHEGSIGYHLRAGDHYFGREDWSKLIKFIKKHEELK